MRVLQLIDLYLNLHLRMLRARRIAEHFDVHTILNDTFAYAAYAIYSLQILLKPSIKGCM